MKDGVENYKGCNAINISSTRARTKMLASFERQRFDRFDGNDLMVFSVVFLPRRQDGV